MIRGLFPILALISLSCSGSSGPHVSLPEVPSAQTRATLVGPRCAGAGHCECRDLTAPSAEEDKPAGKYKRFEVRVGPAQNELWVHIDDNILYKSKQRATDCFYVDLLPGRHPVQVHAKETNGVGVGVQLYELSGGGPWWYETFDFDCSSGGVCDVESIRREQNRIKAIPRGIQDPCGSVKIQGFTWRTGTMPDTIHPGEVVVDFVLNIYEFATKTPADSAECKQE